MNKNHAISTRRVKGGHYQVVVTNVQSGKCLKVLCDMVQEDGMSETEFERYCEGCYQGFVNPKPFNFDAPEFIRRDWRALQDCAESGRILDVYGFDEGETVEELYDNQAQNILSRYMAATGLSEARSFGELSDSLLPVIHSGLPDHSSAEADGISVGWWNAERMGV